VRGATEASPALVPALGIEQVASGEAKSFSGELGENGGARFEFEGAQGRGSMSNHSGSYMLNEIISLLIREQVLEFWGKERTQRIVLEMLSRARSEYDCNPGEILEGHGATLGLCYVCKSPADNVVDDLCRKCRD
jgi:hypothetical protein